MNRARTAAPSRALGVPALLTTDEVAATLRTSRLLPLPPPSAAFHDFDEFERLVQAAKKRDHDAYLVVLLGGEAGLRRGEIAALEWGDIDLKKRQLCVRRSVWKGQTSTPKGGRLRYVPLTERLTNALHAASRFPGPPLFCDSEGKAVGP